MFFEAGHDLAGAVNHLPGHTGHPGNLDAVAVVGGASDDLAKKNNAVGAFNDCCIVVHHSRKPLFKLGKFVIMCCKKSAGAYRLRDILAHGPGNRHAIERAGTATNLIEQDEARSCGVVQNACRLIHLHKEGAFSGGKIVGSTDPGKNPVDKADFGRFGRHETPCLGKQDDESRLSQVRTLSRHVRTRDHQHPLTVIKYAVVLDEGVIGAQQQLKHRMAAALYPEIAAFVDLRLRVSVFFSCNGIGAEAVQLGNHRSVLLNHRSMAGNHGTQLVEQVGFKPEAFLLGMKDLLLILFQSRNSVSLGVDESLFLFIKSRNLVDVSTADLDIVTENPVELNLE